MASAERTPVLVRLQHFNRERVRYGARLEQLAVQVVG
jgi:hypothetical protein